MQGFYHYYKVMDRAMARKKDEPVLDVGVVYLMGTIGENGDFDAGSVGLACSYAAHSADLPVSRLITGGARSATSRRG